MEKRDSRRRVRFLRALSPGFAVLGAFLLAPPALPAAINTSGYLSFSFAKGQAESGWNQGSFLDAQGGFFAQGTITARLSYLLEVRLKSETRVEMEQALIDFSLGRGGSARLGLFLVPFGRYNESNRPQETALIRTPVNLAGLYPSSWRDIGLALQGRMGFLRYAAYLGNGLAEKDGAAAGQIFRDINKDKGMGGRAGFVIGEGFETGFSFYSGKYDSANELRMTLEGADLTWITTDYEVRGEYTQASWKNAGGAAKGKSKGYFILAVLNFRGLQPVFSYQWTDPGDAAAGIPLVLPTEGPEAPGERSRWTLGARYIFAPSFMIKIEYDINKEKGPALKNNLIQVQAALSF